MHFYKLSAPINDQGLGVLASGSFAKTREPAHSKTLNVKGPSAKHPFVAVNPIAVRGLSRALGASHLNV